MVSEDSFTCDGIIEFSIQTDLHINNCTATQ